MRVSIPKTSPVQVRRTTQDAPAQLPVQNRQLHPQQQQRTTCIGRTAPLQTRQTMPNIVVRAQALSPVVRTRAEGPPTAARKPRASEAVRRVVVQEPPPQMEEGPALIPQKWESFLELCPHSPPLGGGAFAEVFKVRDKRTQEFQAMKVMNRPNFTLRGIDRQILLEIEAMKRAVKRRVEGEENHVIRMLDSIEEGEYVYLLLELCERGDLLKLLQVEPTQCFQEDVAAHWIRQLLLGLRTVHATGFIHRDLKPDNLLVTGQGVLKIGDFGWCCLAEEEVTALAGTFQYMAPEVLKNEPQKVIADLWSTGITLHQILFGYTPLQTNLGPNATGRSHEDQNEATALRQQWLLQEISSTCPPAVDLKPAELSDACWNFLRGLLEPDPVLRFDVEAALAQPWITRIFGPRELQTPDVLCDTTASVVQGMPTVEEEEAENVTETIASPPGTPPTPEQPAKDARSPTLGFRGVVSSVPTPQKPRIERSHAYTPPVSPEKAGKLPAENLDKDSEKENDKEQDKEQDINARPIKNHHMLPTACYSLRFSPVEQEPKDDLLGRSSRAPLTSILSPPCAHRSGHSPEPGRKMLSTTRLTTAQSVRIAANPGGSSVRLQGNRYARSPEQSSRVPEQSLRAPRTSTVDVLSNTTRCLSRDLLTATAPASTKASRVTILPPSPRASVGARAASQQGRDNNDIQAAAVSPSTPWQSGRASPGAMRANCTFMAVVAAQFAAQTALQSSTMVTRRYAPTTLMNGLVPGKTQPVYLQQSQLQPQPRPQQPRDVRATLPAGFHSTTARVVSAFPGGLAVPAPTNMRAAPVLVASTVFHPPTRSRRLSVPAQALSGFQSPAVSIYHRCD